MFNNVAIKTFYSPVRVGLNEYMSWTVLDAWYFLFHLNNVLDEIWSSHRWSFAKMSEVYTDITAKADRTLNYIPREILKVVADWEEYKQYSFWSNDINFDAASSWERFYTIFENVITFSRPVTTFKIYYYRHHVQHTSVDDILDLPARFNWMLWLMLMVYMLPLWLWEWVSQQMVNYDQKAQMQLMTKKKESWFMDWPTEANPWKFLDNR